LSWYEKFRTDQSIRQLQADPIYTYYSECCSPLALGLKERMAKASSPPSVLEPQCPSRLVLDRIADKWTALVIQILARGTMRYAQLQRAIGGISQKMLTQTLRSLERDGLVQRKVHPVVPPKVEYSLTRLGRTLIEPLHALCRWSEKHLAELEANRARAKQVAYLHQKP
jgi:DNA-binding HxlR family transcriptional regulator